MGRIDKAPMPVHVANVVWLCLRRLIMGQSPDNAMNEFIIALSVQFRFPLAAQSEEQISVSNSAFPPQPPFIKPPLAELGREVFLSLRGQGSGYQGNVRLVPQAGLSPQHPRSAQAL